MLGRRVGMMFGRKVGRRVRRRVDRMMGRRVDRRLAEARQEQDDRPLFRMMSLEGQLRGGWVIDLILYRVYF